MMLSTQRRGYVFLLSVLVVGTISLAVTTSVLLLSTSAARTGLSLKHSSEALALTHACAERALFELRSDSSYGGSETIAMGNGTCEILVVGGTGNENRTICVEGVRGDVARRMEILITRLLPSVTITSWQEVTAFTSCSY